VLDERLDLDGLDGTSIGSIQSAMSSIRTGTTGIAPTSRASWPGISRAFAAASSNASSSSVCADPTCSIPSTCRPRRVTSCTATAPDAVRTLCTNRETTHRPQPAAAH
jgi:hypothetical protein